MKIKNLISCALCGLTLFACSPSGGEKDAEMDCFITDLMERMTLREKLRPNCRNLLPQGISQRE